MKRYEIFYYAALLVFVVILYGIPYIYMANKPINHWKNIDTTQVVGELQDSCKCTIINDKMYRVKIKMVQQEIYQPYK